MLDPSTRLKIITSALQKLDKDYPGCFEYILVSRLYLTAEHHIDADFHKVPDRKTLDIITEKFISTIDSINNQIEANQNDNA